MALDTLSQIADMRLLHLLSLSPGESLAYLNALDEVDLEHLLCRARARRCLVLLAAKAGQQTALLPTMVHDEFVGAYEGALSQDGRLAGKMCEVVDALQCRGIPVIGYKGPVIWRALRLDSPSKWSSDIDVIIRREDIGAVSAVLGSLSYRLECVTSASAQYSSEGLPDIDLHWSILQWHEQSAAFTAAIWSGLGVAHIGDTDIPVPNPTMTTLALALHAGSHMCIRWGSMHEFARCTSTWHDRIDWEQFLCFARESGCLYGLYPVLMLCCEHFGAVIPGFVMRHMRPPLLRRALSPIAALGFQGRMPSGYIRQTCAVVYGLLASSDAAGTLGYARSILAQMVRAAKHRLCGEW